MEPELTIGVAFTPRVWRVALQRHVRDHVVGVALRLVRDARTTVEEHINVLVVDDEAPFLSPMLMSSLRERGVPVIGLYDPEDVDSAGEGILERLGVDMLLPVDVPAEELLDAARALAVRDDDLAPRFEEVIAGLELDGGNAGIPEHGRLVAVGGPPGAGATEVAVALAQVWAPGSSAGSGPQAHPRLRQPRYPVRGGRWCTHRGSRLAGKAEDGPEEGHVELVPVRLVIEPFGQDFGAEQAGGADERQVVATAVRTAWLMTDGLDHRISQGFDP